jgi:hypothetical protein
VPLPLDGAAEDSLAVPPPFGASVANREARKWKRNARMNLAAASIWGEPTAEASPLLLFGYRSLPTRASSVAFKIRFSNVWIPSGDQAVRHRFFINKDSYPVAGLDRIEAQGRACEHDLAGLESEPELGKMAPQPIQRGARPPRKRP